MEKKQEIIRIIKKYRDTEYLDTAADEILRLFDVTGRHSWLNKDDLEFAVALQEENRLEAVKWLCEKAKGHFGCLPLTVCK
jgi:hypothetical protein